SRPLARLSPNGARASKLDHRLESGRHPLALFRALTAGLRARLAMIMGMPATLLGAIAANLRTELAEGLGIGAVTGHQQRGHRAHTCAVAIELDTAGHHLHVFLAQAGCRTGFASEHTVGTSLDARLVTGIEHGISSVGSAGPREII